MISLWMESVTVGLEPPTNYPQAKSQVAVSVFGHPTPICPWTPTTTLKKKIQHSKAFYKVPNTKPPIKL
jgi:hypothetical protein